MIKAYKPTSTLITNIEIKVDTILALVISRKHTNDKVIAILRTMLAQNKMTLDIIFSIVPFFFKQEYQLELANYLCCRI